MSLSIRLKSTDVVAVGLMTFALFLGAGNLIFPPFLGQLAGEAVVPAAAGFLLTGVGLPLLGLMVAAKLGGGLDRFTQDLPKWAAMLTGIVLYLAIGPLFAAPRTAVVSFEMGVLPFVGEESTGALALYSAGFFLLTLVLALFPGRLIETVGKLITPLLVLVLVAIAIGVFAAPQGVVAEAGMHLEEPAFIYGFKQGYQTMDTLASLAFGIVIITALRQRGVEDRADLTRYTIIAAIIAAVGLSVVYIVLSYLGATSYAIAAGAENGARILNLYITAVFGDWGMIILALTIGLACLTTSVGLMTACGEYFAEVLPVMGYRGYVVLCTIVSALIANMGLTELLAVTIPALLVVYPIAIALIMLCLFRERFAQPGIVFAFTLLPVLAISIVDGLSAAGLSFVQPLVDVYSHLPLQSSGLGWMVPGVAGFVIGMLKSGSPVRQESLA
ncbi:branched-chain amino acid transport system II carrier protein [Kistimonas asteriae]|uniref:branched-chain amino acid transport system II carrier protein n=1 Tax=Kistimonas asteriae TaxID=517724 RepID=UPI001FE856FD|nr:branched-chain amino acid transport system II carrier protein [Kistimonas asteriae]